MNKTDVIEAGCPPPNLAADTQLRRKDTQGQMMLLISLCFSFHLSPPSFARSPGLGGGITEHTGGSVQTPKAAQRRGAAGGHAIINWRLRAARLGELLESNCNCQHCSLLGNMKADKQRNYSASYGYTGRDKRRGHRGAGVRGGPGRTFSIMVPTE